MVDYRIKILETTELLWELTNHVCLSQNSEAWLHNPTVVSTHNYYHTPLQSIAFNSFIYLNKKIW